MFTAEFLQVFLVIVSMLLAVYIALEELDEKPRKFRTNLFIYNPKKDYVRKKRKWFKYIIR